MNLPTLLGSLRKKTLAAAAVRPAARRPRLSVETLESREVPATIPTPVISEESKQSLFDAVHNTALAGFAPVTITDPTTPSHMVTVYSTGIRIMGVVSTDGGTSWTTVPFSINDKDLNGGSRGFGVEPKASVPNIPPVFYTVVGNPQAAFDKFGNFFVTFVESDAARTSGRVVVKKFAFGTGNPGNPSVAEIYKFVDHDIAYNPTIAIDTAAASYTDPQGGLGLQVDPHTTSQTTANTTVVYVAWNEHNDAPADPNDALNFNPDVIRMSGSNNGGAVYTPPMTVNDDLNHNGPPARRYSTPKIVFTPGRAGKVGSGGVMVTAFDTGTSIFTDSLNMTSTNLPRGVSKNGPGGGITDAIAGTNGAPDSPQSTSFPINVLATDVPSGFVLKDVAIDLSISHQALADLRITLTPPGGSPITLLLNKTLPDGNDSGNGITGSQMGILVSGNIIYQAISGGSSPVYSTFSNSAARNIHDASTADPHIEAFRPEAGFLPTSGTAVGIWTLTITDNKNGSTGALLGWRVRMTGNAPLGLGADNRTFVQTLRGNFDGSTFPDKPPALPNLPAGIGPGITMAVDNSIGGFSAYQNRVYLAYTAPIRRDSAGNLLDSAIGFLYSDDGGVNWSFPAQADDDLGVDGISSGDRIQFLPELAVDATTGTLGLAYYDTRWDAAGMRVTTRFTSAIDMPDYAPGDPQADASLIQLAPSTYFNSTERAFDQIQFRSVNLEPVPSNMRTAGTDLFGNSFGLQMRNGKVVSVWAGNLDNNGTQLRTQDVEIAAGPRIVRGDQGPVIGPPRLSSFQVVFDRFVDPASFGPGDVELRYYAPDEDPTGPGTPIAISDVSPDDEGDFGAKTFTVTLQTPQTKVGVYTYRIGSDIRDRIRQSTSASPTFNQMDQNANGTENEGLTDNFAAPDPVNGIPFELPYKTGSFPLIVPGPRLVSSQVIGNPTTADNLVINKTVSSIDVTFDRNIDTTSFTAADVIRITGPIGDISGVGGVVPLRFDVPSNSWVEDPTLAQATRFRVKFPAQVLSGTYRIQLSSDIQDMLGNKLDTNQNAGVSTFMGSVPTGGVPDVAHYDAGTLSVPIAANSTVTIPLDVPDSFVLQKVLATLSITYPDMRQLEGRLIAPDGTTVLLFKNVPQVGSSFANMTNTVFDDDALTAIQQGIAPFANSAFTPVQPLSQMIGHASRSSTGKFRLMITNKGTSTGTITRFTLDLSRLSSGTGLGEPAADQTSVGFRIFQTDPTSDIVKGTWTPVGPTQVESTSPVAHELTTAGRVGAIAVDPSDPSGNTVFVAGSTGGVWKTTNFMTRDAAGPTYVPLTDFGSTNAINVGSIAVWNNTNDPTKSFIIVGTGSDSMNQDLQHLPIGFDGTADGVGFLVSEDGGKSWRVLDSTVNNTPTFPFPALPFSDSARNHLFVGAVVNKVLFDPVLDPQTTRPTIYAAVGQGTAGSAQAAGLWRSSDGGRTWSKLADPANPAIVRPLPAGDVTDVVLAAASADKGVGSTQQPQVVYAAVRGQGVYESTNRGGGFDRMLGLVGKPLIRDDDPGVLGTQAVPVNNPSSDPNGSKALITLATPVLAKSALANTYYAGWLAVAVSNTGGNLDGLYITKDFGGNWTKIRLPDKLTNPDLIIPTNDETQPDFDPANGSGKSELQVVFDPNDPNIVYLGSDMVVRADITAINDPHKLATYEHSNNDGGQIRPDTTGSDPVKHRETQNPLDPNFRRPGLQGFTVDGQWRDDPLSGSFYEKALRFLDDPSNAPVRPLAQGDPPVPASQGYWNYVNLFRDPQQPFPNAVIDATLFVRNEASNLNDGTDVHWFYVTDQALLDSDVFVPTQSINDLNAINRMLTVVDPITGLGRLIYGDDHGVHTVVMNPDLPVSTNYDQVGWIGGADYQINGDRNGNLQIAEFHSGAVQPSLLAADIAGALFYGVGHIPQDASGSDPHMVETGTATTGNQVWHGDTKRGPANWVETDPTGTGTVFILRRPTDTSIATDFFQVVLPGTNFPIGRVGSQSGASLLEAGDNPSTGAGQWDFSVDRFTVNPFSHTNGGTDPTAIGVAISSKTGNIFRTIDTGLHWAKIFHTPDGRYAPAVAYGAPAPNDPFVHNYLYAGTTGGHVYVSKDGFTTFSDITLNLDGTPIQQIVPSTVRGSNMVYVLTRDHVYFMADWTAAGAQWVDVTGNLFALTHKAFGNPDWDIPLLTRLNTIAVDWRSSFTGRPTFPVLYAGGDGGVFRSLDNGTTWSQFPAGAVVPGVVGGNLPVTNVTNLDLSIGNFNGDTGRYDSNGARDLLVATTFGRGTFEISIGRPDSALGPQVLSAVRAPGDDVIGPLSHFRVTFSEAMDPSSFTAADFVKITGPNGAIDPNTIGITATAVPNTGQEVFDVAFTTLSNDGIYTFTFGPQIATPSGVFMDQNQNGVKGEVPGDSFTTQFVVGVNDVSDYIRDSFDDLLGRDPTTAEFLSKNAKAIDTARFSALTFYVKELLSTYNPDPALNGKIGEARQVLVERLFRINGPFANEIGNLDPAYLSGLSTQAQTDLINGFATQLKTGTTSPERIIIAILSDPTFQYRGALSNPEYVDKVFTDLLGRAGTAAEHTKYDGMVGTQTGSKTFVAAVVNGAAFRDRLTGFLYQRYLGRAPSTTEKSAARTLIGIPLVANALQGSERVLQKILASHDFFSLQTQNETAGAMADNGLHTNRSWIEGVFAARFVKTTGELFGRPQPNPTVKVSTTAERDLYSQKILDRYKTQRNTFERGLVASVEFRTITLKNLYTQVFGLTLTDLATITKGLNSLAVGATFQGVTAGWLGSTDFYNLAPALSGQPAASRDTWAKAVILRMLGRPATPAEVTALAAKAGTTVASRTAAAAALLNGTAAAFPNGNEYRTDLVTAAFNLILHRAPSAAELTAYSNFLKVNRWEYMLTDIMAIGKVDLDPVTAGVQNALPREFWEIAD
jgi:subtilisin-like proprotein convertase family protein